MLWYESKQYENYFYVCKIEHPALYKGIANPYGFVAIEKEIN